MKKIIKAKLYDTDTAKHIGEWSNNHSYGDFSYCQENLYLKKTGEYFLFGKGGPMSKYRTSCGDNSWSGGSTIIPLSYEAARKWAEEQLTADEYEGIFGEVPETNGNAFLSVSISEAVIERLRRKSSETNTPISELVEMACRAILE